MNQHNPNSDKELNSIKLGNIYGYTGGGNFGGSVFDVNGLCPTLTSMSGGNRQPMIVDIYSTKEIDNG